MPGSANYTGQKKKPISDAMDAAALKKKKKKEEWDKFVKKSGTQAAAAKSWEKAGDKMYGYKKTIEKIKR